MHRLHRIARLIIAVLPETVRARLTQEYKLPISLIDFAEREIYKTNLPNKDTVTEWVLRQTDRHEFFHNQASHDEYMGRLVEAVDFFFKNNTTPKFRELLLRTHWEKAKANPKNLFNYGLHQLELLARTFYESADNPYERTRVQKLQAELPPGARLFHNDGTVQIVEIRDAETACQMASGSMWCVSERQDTPEQKGIPHVAQTYVKRAPLYMIFVRGKKTALFHVDLLKGMEFQDLQRNDLPVAGPMGEALYNSGLAEKAFVALIKRKDLLEIFNWFTDKEIKKKLEAKVAQHGALSAMYAEVLEARFPLGEPAIIDDFMALNDYEAMLRERGLFEEFRQEWAAKGVEV